MDVRFDAADVTKLPAQAVVLPVAARDGKPVLTQAGMAFDAMLEGGLLEALQEAQFSGKTAETLTLPTFRCLAARRLVAAGVGDLDRFEAEAFTRAVGAAAQAARSAGATEIVVALPDGDWGLDTAAAIEAGAIGARLGLYRFDAYRGAAAPSSVKSREVETVTFIDEAVAPEAAGRALDRAAATARAVDLARDLGNEPASVLTPETLADRAAVVAREAGLQVEILGPEELAAIGANATLAVGGGSAHPPRMIRLRYEPEGSSEGRPVPGLVGKAITFDTGGYSIKPYEGMLEMKGDMAGGAAVLGAMSALRDLGCRVPVEATICAAENMISGTAFRPGDVLTGMNGVTMEILSTDAEGRLVLADGLVDTARRGATELIDLATLTGAAVVALGNGATALFASDDRLADALLEAAGETGERMWRMPLFPELEEQIEGEVGDIKNTGGRAGGAITGALFLQHFREGLPWAHLDIAPASRQSKATATGPKGATGVGVRTLLRYLTELGTSTEA
ncbi:MAG: leucyl aminopeptidase [Thermomicrobiales bacterium]|nr:leucyl aminopeptidase [Thermomicrobiales bacterium]